MRKKSKIWNKLIYAVNLFTAFLLFLTSTLSFFETQFLAVLSLFVPFLFFLNLVFLVFWLLRRKRQFLLSFLSLLFGYISFGSFYGFGEKSKEPLDSDLKVMSYNVWSFNKNGWLSDPSVGTKIMGLINKEDPDVVCIQEHNRRKDPQFGKYPYRTVTPYIEGIKRTAQAIYSKYPIIDDGSLNLPKTINNIIFADLVVEKDTIRVYNLHLQSFNIVPSSRTFSSDQSEKNYKRMVSTFAKQQEQVQIFDEHRATSPYKTIVCGDFNNTQFSHVYKTASDGLIDSFLEKGNGFGKTYSLKGFPLRIDYILADPEFEVIAHKNYTERLSDHYPIMATLRLKQ